MNENYNLKEELQKLIQNKNEIEENYKKNIIKYHDNLNKIYELNNKINLYEIEKQKRIEKQQRTNLIIIIILLFQIIFLLSFLWPIVVVMTISTLICIKKVIKNQINNLNIEQYYNQLIEIKKENIDLNKKNNELNCNLISINNDIVKLELKIFKLELLESKVIEENVKVLKKTI